MIGSVDDAFKALRDEHRVVERMLRALDGIGGMLGNHSIVAADLLLMIIPLVQKFIALHHAKEEDVVFPVLDVGSWRYHDTLEVLMHEHRRGHDLLSSLLEAATSYSQGNGAAKQPILGMIDAYGRLLREHINVEDNSLFSTSFLASRQIPQDKVQKALMEFNERELRDVGDQQDCVDLLERIEKEIASKS